MRKDRRRSRSRAFTLIELLVVVAVITVLLSLLLPALASARRRARAVVCASNMRQLSTAEFSYSVDAKDRIGAMNWVPGNGHSTYPDCRSLVTDRFEVNQGKQACDIVRRRTGRAIPLVQGRSFNRNFWHLVLADAGYFGSTPKVIVPGAACPDDDWVNTWQKNEGNFAALAGPDGTAGGAESNYIWYRPYWCTYQLSPVAWTIDRAEGKYPPLTQNPENEHIYITPPDPGAPTGQRRFDEVTFASQKVFFHDLFDRHSRKRPIWFGYAVAIQPLAFFDGSVRTCKTGDAQIGWDPFNPDANTHITYTYDPKIEFPGYNWPTLSGNPTDQIDGYYRWTRGGLKGVDYAGTGHS